MFLLKAMRRGRLDRRRVAKAEHHEEFIDKNALTADRASPSPAA
jgi:hypothetical protein